LGEFVTAFVGHDDSPNTPSPAPPQGDRYSLGLAASGNVIGQVMASLVRDARQLPAFNPTTTDILQ